MNSILNQLNESVDSKNLNYFKGISEHYTGLFKELILTIYKDGYNNGVNSILIFKITFTNFYWYSIISSNTIFIFSI